LQSGSLIVQFSNAGSYALADAIRVERIVAIGGSMTTSVCRRSRWGAMRAIRSSRR